MTIDNSKEKLLYDFEVTPFEVWKKEVEHSLKGKPYDKIFSKTIEELEIKPIYTKDDLEKIEKFISNIPGENPYLRGYNYLGYKEKSWTIVQKFNHPDPIISNKMIKDEILKGLTGISLSLFFPDGNYVFNPKEIKNSIYILNNNDLKALFEDIDLIKYPIFIDFYGNIELGNKILNEFFKEHNIKNVNLNYDIISNYLSKGLVLKNLEKELELIATCNNINNISINLALYQNAGATIIQELAFLLAIVNFFLNLNNVENKITILKKLWIKTAIGQNFFFEIAKLRAMKVLISKLFELNEVEVKPHIQATTTQINKSKLDPYTNMLRLTGEVLSSVLGGVDSIEAGYFDEMFGISSENSRRFSRNLQLILNSECNLTEIIDPAAGSYYIETISKELAEKSWELFQHIENLGGIINIIKDGNLQKWITLAANTRKDNINNRKEILVGVNKYANLIDSKIEVCEVDFEQLQKRFDNAKSDNSSFITNKLDLNNYIEVSNIDRLILSTPFEKLKDKSIEYFDKFGNKPKVFLANIGSLKEYKPRADFAQDFLRVGYFDVIYNRGFETIEDVAIEFFKSESTIICLCSSDLKYPEIVKNFVHLIRKAKPLTYIMLAGYPVDNVEQFKQDGIDDFIHLKANIYTVLENLYNNLLIQGA